MWLCTPRMRFSSSARKPFITDMTMMSAATPMAMPASENAGDDGDEALFPARAQVPEGDETLERGKDHAPSRCSAASTLSSTFSPVLRFFISTWPLAAPRGPTTSCHGRPIRSISANLAPARSSRSS